MTAAIIFIIATVDPDALRHEAERLESDSTRINARFVKKMTQKSGRIPTDHNKISLSNRNFIKETA